MHWWWRQYVEEESIYLNDEGAVYALMCGSSLLMEECTLMDPYKIVDGRIYINGCL